MSYDTRDNVDQRILKTYSYGSRVYGCNKEYSDYDYILVVESDEDLNYNVNLTNTNLKVFSENVFIESIREHKIYALECIFQSKDDPYLKYFELDKEKLRVSISSVSSNSFVKCKKKLKQGDYYIGKKSLFHSIRILGFGNQVALTGRIVDYSAYNYIYDIIMNMESNEWNDYQEVFQPVFNKMKSRFKILAPLESDKKEV